MNFNHLISRAEMMRPCVHDLHAYYPSGHIEAMIGGSIAVRFRCKKCGSGATSFLIPEEYGTYRNVIERYIESKGA